jgi:AraC-like DNA-binding protein
MPVLCDTSVVPPDDRAEVWVHAASELFVPLECTPHNRVFNGRMRAGSVGPLRLCSVEAAAHTIRRTQRLADNTKNDQYKLSLMLGGEALIVQDDREAVLRAGDFAIYDSARPYTVVGDDAFHMLVCMLPRDVIGLSQEQIARITATRIAGQEGIGWAMAPFLKRLAELAVREEIHGDQHRVVESVVDLVESLCASRVDDDAPRGGSRTELLLRIRAYIETNLADPALSPSAIAAATFVSKRYLHKLFEVEEVSVSRWIRERRLERCRAELGDPRHRDDTVTSIGVRWGIPDSAHFSRLFREAYGCTPTEFRHAALTR